MDELEDEYQLVKHRNDGWRGKVRVMHSSPAAMRAHYDELAERTGQGENNRRMHERLAARKVQRRADINRSRGDRGAVLDALNREARPERHDRVESRHSENRA